MSKRGMRTCEICGIQYKPSNDVQRTCSHACGVAWRRTVSGTLPDQPKRQPCPGCGELTWGKLCQPCRRVSGACRVWPRNCTVCTRSFIARHPSHLTCSSECSKKRSSRSDDYHRHKRSVRRSVTKDSDITPQQEGEMRRRARKCPLCAVRMTAEAGKPNSKELDHIVPLGVGGTHTHGNVRIICRLCNLKRPKDGSDYSGPVTLWATAPGVVIKPKVQAVPPPPKPRKLAGYCACGAPVSMRTRQGSRCHACLVALGQEAARLRAWGMKWQEIAEKLDYPNTGSLFGLVRLYGRDSNTNADNAIY